MAKRQGRGNNKKERTSRRLTAMSGSLTSGPAARCRVHTYADDAVLHVVDIDFEGERHVLVARLGKGFPVHESGHVVPLSGHRDGDVLHLNGQPLAALYRYFHGVTVPVGALRIKFGLNKRPDPLVVDAAGKRSHDLADIGDDGTGQQKDYQKQGYSNAHGFPFRLRAEG
jgi:hypothetical protein